MRLRRCDWHGGCRRRDRLGGALSGRGLGPVRRLGRLSIRHFRGQHQRRLVMGMITELVALKIECLAGDAGLSHHRHSGRLHHLLHFLARQRAFDRARRLCQARRPISSGSAVLSILALFAGLWLVRGALCLKLRTIAEDDDGIRLDRWFRRHYPALTHARAGKTAAQGRSAAGRQARQGRRPRRRRARSCACRRR